MTWDTEEMSEAHSGLDSAIIWSDDPEKAYFRSLMNERQAGREAEGRDVEDSLIGESTMAELMEEQTLQTFDPPALNLQRSGLSYSEDDTVAKIEPDQASAREWFTRRHRESKRKKEPMSHLEMAIKRQSPISALSPNNPGAKVASKPKHTKNDVVAAAAQKNVPGFIFVTSDHPSAIRTTEAAAKQKRENAAETTERDDDRRSHCFYGKIAVVILLFAVLVATVMLILVFKQRRENEVTSSQEFANDATLPPFFQFSRAPSPTDLPFSTPSLSPNDNFTPTSSAAPTQNRTQEPAPYNPTPSPNLPNKPPTTSPTNAPTSSPTQEPEPPPPNSPTRSPTIPTDPPTPSPTRAPVISPTTLNRTPAPSPRPSRAPIVVTNPTSTPTSSPTDGILDDFLAKIVALSPQSSGALANPNSPQSKALLWTVNDLNAATYSDSRMVQRWVSATLYYSTSGSDWSDSTLWMTSASECEWFSIRCDVESRVDVIGLRDNNLEGPLPSELHLLSESMESLSFNDNKISGTLPTTLGLFTNLGRLSLTANQISGPIPSELGGLANAGFLAISRNNLGGQLPSELGLLRLLKTLDLARNEISGTIPTEYGEMLSIEFINVRENPISGEVPSELGQLPFLETLAVGRTDLTGGMPAEICGMNIELKADCEEISCECCTVCCADGGDCYANTLSPTQFPSRLPTPSPTTPFPTMAPVPGSTPLPTQEASQTPTMPPTKGPTALPSAAPSRRKTASPTILPTTASPTANPFIETNPPTQNPTQSPTRSPSSKPTRKLTQSPTRSPSSEPTRKPTGSPTGLPATASPAPAPSPKPTSSPTPPASSAPTLSPTSCPADIETDKMCYVNGEDIVVYFDNCNPEPDDWIGVYPANSNPDDLGDPTAWSWACGDMICSESVDIGEATFHEARGFGNFQVFLVRRLSGGPYKAYGFGNEFLIATSC